MWLCSGYCPGGPSLISIPTTFNGFADIYLHCSGIKTRHSGPPDCTASVTSIFVMGGRWLRGHALPDAIQNGNLDLFFILHLLYIGVLVVEDIRSAMRIHLRVFVERAESYMIFWRNMPNLLRCTGHLEITIRLYEHVSSLWYYEGWLPEDSVEYAAAHYAAYSVKRPDRLCFISLDTDMCKSNYFSYVNATAPDTFSILSFLTDEPQAAEDAGECAYQIVDRCSPHVIAKIFYGHTHEYQLSVSAGAISEATLSRWSCGLDLQIFYSNNATAMSAEAVRTVSWQRSRLHSRH
ncbi:hypothetical protein F5141DRAFT_1204670 [Pisolithus sp. B1]|nr:hypothetical protein F5141DRAFT_1204670 [Pisolithus sp. B1]